MSGSCNFQSLLVNWKMNYIISFHIKNNSSSSFCLGCFDKKKSPFLICQINIRTSQTTMNAKVKIRHILPLEKSTVLLWLECKEGTIVYLLSISRPPTPLHHNQPRNGFHDNLINQTINSLQLEGEMVQKRYGHKNS